MYKHNWLRKVMVVLMLVGMGGTTFQLSGCDQAIRSTVLTGLNGATDTLLLSLTSALFQSLDQTGQDDELTGDLTGGTTTQ
ncbi:MAG: hypothetical protein HJJLKODD_01077 [Phycisphaerae bacterium]|nr:hypothetical protein [Phycisphaerae bacterium]